MKFLIRVGIAATVAWWLMPRRSYASLVQTHAEAYSIAIKAMTGGDPIGNFARSIRHLAPSDQALLMREYERAIEQ